MVTKHGQHLAKLSLRNLVKSYGPAAAAVQGINLDVADREFVVLVGPSGCGKSTTLRMIAGLESVTSGEIRIADQLVNTLPARQRDIAMVFQNYALYPHLTVFQNIAFGLELRKTPRPEIRARVDEASRILGLAGLLARYPRALSGGQRQRVAMGRAIVRHPRLFLFDEPLSNLDAKLRMQMRSEIKRVHQTVETTTIYVTHDQVEAMTLADRVVVMNAGRIEQVAPPQELYAAPATRFVATFIGSPGMNILPATLESGGKAARLDGGSVIALPAELASRAAPLAGKPVLFGTRPEHLAEQAAGAADAASLLADVLLVEPMGMDTLVHARVGEETVIARCDPSVAARPGEAMRFGVDVGRISLFDPADGRAI